MRIILLCDGLGIGGAETHVVTLAKGLAALGDTVTVVSDGGGRERELVAAGVACVTLPYALTSSRFWRNLPALARLCRRVRPDILHAHTRRTAFLLSYMKGEGLRVVTAHALFSGRKAFSYWGERTIAVSADLKEHLVRRFGVLPGRVTVIPNGIDTAHFTPPAEDRGRALSVTFASRLGADTSLGAFLLLQCAAEWQRCAGAPLRLTVLGGGAYLEALKEKAAKCGVAVAFPGSVADTAPYLQTSALFVGVSRCALEAAACGCAVLLCGNEGFGGLLTPTDFDRFARGNFTCRGEALPTREALNAAFSDFLHADASVFAAVACRVRDEFSAGAMITQTRRLYESKKQGG